MTKTVLLVEDEPDIMRILSYYLTNSGYRVLQAYGVEDACRKLEKFPVNLIVTDLHMPGLSGVSLIEWVRQSGDHMYTPIVVVTAFTWDGIGRAAADAGADALITKPVDRQQFVKTIHEVMVRYAARDQAMRAAS